MDLLIIGTGPAGCAAAISARAHGLSVALLNIGNARHQLAGETLHPGVEPLLRQLSVWEKVESCSFHRHTGLWHVGLDGCRTFQPYGGDNLGPWRGLQVDRITFHHILREQAISVGVHWNEVHALTRAQHDQDGWTIETTSGAPFKASTVIDATGRRAWLTSQLGLTPEYLDSTQRVQFGWSAKGEEPHDGNPIFSEHRDGWDWDAPIGDGRHAWVRLRQGADQPGLDVTPRIYRECSGPDWFLIGDAASLTTPASGNGVLRALMSGIYAVHLYSNVHSGLLSAEQSSNAYKAWIELFWEHSVAGAKTAHPTNV